MRHYHLRHYCNGLEFFATFFGHGIASAVQFSAVTSIPVAVSGLPVRQARTPLDGRSGQVSVPAIGRRSGPAGRRYAGYAAERPVFINELSTPEGVNRLAEALYQHDLLPDFPLNRYDCALYAWMADPGLAQMLHRDPFKTYENARFGLL